MAAIALENPLQWKRPLPVEDDDRPDSTQKRPRTGKSNLDNFYIMLVGSISRLLKQMKA